MTKKSYTLVLAGIMQELLPLYSCFDSVQTRHIDIIRITTTKMFPSLLFAASGMGPWVCRDAMIVLFQQYQINSIVLWGTTVSLHREICIGDFCVATSTCMPMQDERASPVQYPCFNELSNRIYKQAGICFPRVHKADFYCSTEPIVHSGQIDKRIEHICAVADMESWAVADYASMQNIPFAITKLVSDSFVYGYQNFPTQVIQKYKHSYISLLQKVFL